MLFVETVRNFNKFVLMVIGQPVIVAIPVRNEETHLKACLDALAAQTRKADGVILLLNNCTDGSLAICHQARGICAGIQIVECDLHDENASAGEARRRAVDAAQRLAADGVVLTTDADSVVPATWIADNLGEISWGADCVCGMAVIAHEEEDARRRLEFDDMREALLLSLQDEIAAFVDPDPFDPWPRHQQHSGASIAVRACVLRRAGGVPRIAAGEDRALVANLCLVDAKIRHAPNIQVVVSGRLQGRAAGGMAETLARRLQRLDRLTDDRLEPTVDAYRRVLTRRRLRGVCRGDTALEDLAADLLIDPRTLRAALQAPYFGQAWACIQRESPVLRRRRVDFVDLARETRQAFALRGQLRDPVAEPLRHAI